MFMLMKSFCLFILLDLSLCIYNFSLFFRSMSVLRNMVNNYYCHKFLFVTTEIKVFPDRFFDFCIYGETSVVVGFFFLRTSPVYGFKQSLQQMRCSWLGKKTVCPIILGTPMGLIKVFILVLCFHKRHLHRNKF